MFAFSLWLLFGWLLVFVLFWVCVPVVGCLRCVGVSEVGFFGFCLVVGLLLRVGTFACCLVFWIDWCLFVVGLGCSD